MVLKGLGETKFMKSSGYFEITAAIKRLLKEKGLGYRTLSVRTGIPLSTLKKNLTARDCSLDRVNRICEALDVSLEEVLSTLAEQKQSMFSFSDEQAAYLKENPQAFSLYWYLVFERKEVDEISGLMKLNTRALNALLLKLDKLALLALQPGDRIKLPRMRPVRWVRGDAFIESLFHGWAKRLLSEALAKTQSEKSLFILQMYQLTPESAKELAKAVEDLDREFSQRTIREMRMHPGKATPIRAAFIQEPGSFMG